jgi:thymidylate synthase (FAD)
MYTPDRLLMDRFFQVKVVAAVPEPQRAMYVALHQDYSEEFVLEAGFFPSERRCGEIVVQRLLSGDRGHYGPLEHVQIIFNCGYFPHGVVQQARTHRVGVSFDVQSMRWTGLRFLDVAKGKKDVEEVFYLRPIGFYSDRSGAHYHYSSEMRERDLEYCLCAARQYAADISAGMSEEHARGKLPFDYRQHFVASFNLRSLLHFLDLRMKKDAQLEIQELCNLMYPHVEAWVPEIAAWYRTYRWGKAKLSP